MAESHVVSALRDKRAEVSGLIADLERRIAQQRTDLVHVDAVLRLYAPDLEPASIPVKAVVASRGVVEIRYPSGASEIIIPVTNAIESLNAKLRQAVRVRGHFPTDEAGHQAALPGLEPNRKRVDHAGA